MPRSIRLSRRAGRAAIGAALLAAALSVAPATASAAPDAACAQPTHVWLATPAGSLGDGNTLTLPIGTETYETGVVLAGSNITFTGTNGINQIPTTTAGANCVVSHQNNILTIGAPTGTYPIFATYTPWETGIPRRTLVGYINVVN
jgi:hypothetical protein